MQQEGSEIFSTRHRPLTSWPPYLPPADSLNAGNQLKFARPANLGSKSKVDSKVFRIDPFSKSAKKAMHFVARSPLDFGWGSGKIVAGVYYGYCFGGSAFTTIVATW